MPIADLAIRSAPACLKNSAHGWLDKIFVHGNLKLDFAK
jgi:hypothetical protein